MSVFVFSNLATSLDGKIATRSLEFFPLGTSYDRQQMLKLRDEADAVVMGASTLRSFRKPCLGTNASRRLLNVIVSNRLDGISAEWPFFKSSKIDRVLFVGPGAPQARIKRFEKRSDVIVLTRPTRKKTTATQIIGALETRGVQRLLVEGGGTLMWDFASEDLIDEYHVTLTPRILGGKGAPTLVDGAGLDVGQVVNLQLAQCRVVGSELYLIYRKTGIRS